MSVAARLRRTDRTLLALLAITAVALLARLVLLGARVQHFDEARVGWWTLEFMRTGGFEYRYIIHGPFVQHVNTWVFSVLGPTDFASRLVVAVVGGLLPLAVWLLREHLRRPETVAVAAFLGFNPLLLYYSRFFRSTVLVAAFMFVAFGLLVRLYDTRRPRYLHLAVLFVALGFTAKENAVIYLLCWLGAGTLVVALSLYARPEGRTGVDRLRAYVAGITRPDDRVLAGAAGHLALAVGLFLVVIVFFYAPRGGPNGLYGALGAPTRLPETLGAMVQDIEVGYRYWFGHASEPGCHKDNLVDAYACFLEQTFGVLSRYAGPLVGLALVGTLVEHFAVQRPRAVVLVTSYWGLVSVFGYPLGTDIFGAWILVNALVPLAVPAGVGLALFYRLGLDAYRDDDRVGAAAAAVVVLLVAGQFVAVGVGSSYAQPTGDDNDLVQYAQPPQSWRGTLDDVHRLAGQHEGTDVLFYGDAFVDGDAEAVRTPACVKWFAALPLPWYLAKDRVEVGCAMNESALDARSGELPPVVIADVSKRDELADRLGDGYEARVHFIPAAHTDAVVFVRR